MQNKKFVFAGNRAGVLKKMRELGLTISKIWAVEGSWLQRYLEENHIDYSVIEKKKEFFRQIKEERFDYFISNGLPVILPISELRRDGKEFINIHPSLLPELRGRDPIPGALLHRKPAGVTCHYMNDDIDSGEIISQIEIDMTPDLEAGLLYQLSFIAEAEVFEKAYYRDFQVEKAQQMQGREIYYSFSEEDLFIDLEHDSAEEMIARVKAFATRSKGAILSIGKETYQCWQIERIENEYLKSRFRGVTDETVILKYEDKLIFKHAGDLLKATVTILCRGGVQRKLRAIYKQQSICFPLIGAVIEGNTEGVVFCNDRENPSHVFVINKFGFSQELHESWDKEFFEVVIKRYIRRSERQKLRLYHPQGELLAFLNSLEYAQPARRTHFRINRQKFDRFTVMDGSLFQIVPMTEDNFQNVFSLDLDSRYYKDAYDFCDHAIPLVAVMGDEVVGIIYGAGNDGTHYEIDYYVSEKQRNRGIGSNLVYMFTKKCLEKEKITDMDIYSNNTASIKAAKKCGYEEVLEYEFFNIQCV